MIHPREAELFNDSFDRCAKKSSFYDCFYDKFLNSSEEVVEKFKNTDFKRQKKMLRTSLSYMLMFTMSSNLDYMRRVAVSHDKDHMDIKPEMYELWLNVMIETVKEMDPRCTKETENAWRSILKPGVDFMIAVYEGRK